MGRTPWVATNLCPNHSRDSWNLYPCEQGLRRVCTSQIMLGRTNSLTIFQTHCEVMGHSVEPSSIISNRDGRFIGPFEIVSGRQPALAHSLDVFGECFQAYEEVGGQEASPPPILSRRPSPDQVEARTY